MKTAQWITLICLSWLALAGSIPAQDYSFSIPSAEVVLTLQPDASIIIDYALTFSNTGRDIDVVDVGMPNKKYTVLAASVNGNQVKDWRPSTYISCGPEVRLGANTIRRGSTGVFTCRARVRDMVYQDSLDPARAAMQFTPTWYSGRFYHGRTTLKLIVKFPPGVHPDEVVWHQGLPPFDMKGALDPEGVAFVAWTATYPMTGPRMFGCSFPRAAMARIVETHWWNDFAEWWLGAKNVQTWSGILLICLFAGIFFTATRGTGWFPFLIALGGMLFIFWKFPMLHLALWAVISLMGALWWMWARKGRPRYMPAVARVERGAICRGLSPAEAAVLLERPFQQVIALIVQSFLDRGLLTVVQPSPLRVARAGTALAPNLVSLAGGKRVALEPWEVGFYAILCAPGDVAGKDFTVPLKNLIGFVQCKLEGMDPAATRDYYRAVSERSWQNVERAAKPADKDALAARYRDWLALDEDYDDRLRRQERAGWTYRPGWWRRSDYYWRDNLYRATDRAAAQSKSLVSLPKLDLSKVDHFTVDQINKALESASSGRGGGGGGFGGCACACAGCACACACAGGGR